MATEENKRMETVQAEVRPLKTWLMSELSGGYSCTNGLVQSGRHRSICGRRSRRIARRTMTSPGIMAKYGRAHGSNLASSESCANQMERKTCLLLCTYPNPTTRGLCGSVGSANINGDKDRVYMRGAMSHCKCKLRGVVEHISRPAQHVGFPPRPSLSSKLCVCFCDDGESVAVDFVRGFVVA
jgi:hypothetical protein